MIVQRPAKVIKRMSEAVASVACRDVIEEGEEDDQPIVEDEEAKFQVMKLLAEMEAMDKEAERLRAILEIEQLQTMLATMTEVSNSDAAVEAVRSAIDNEASSPESVMTLSEPSSPAPLSPPVQTTRPPRRSVFSVEDEARLALQSVDEVRTPPRASEVDRHAAQTGTLRMLMEQQRTSEGSGSASVAASAETVSELAGRMLADAEKQFVPDPAFSSIAGFDMSAAVENPTATATELLRMEAALRALTLQKEMAEEQVELRRLTEMLKAAGGGDAASSEAHGGGTHDEALHQAVGNGES